MYNVFLSVLSQSFKSTLGPYTVPPSPQEPLTHYYFPVFHSIYTINIHSNTNFGSNIQLLLLFRQTYLIITVLITIIIVPSERVSGTLQYVQNILRTFVQPECISCEFILVIRIFVM